MSKEKRSKSLLGAIAVLGASIGAVSTAHSEGIRLSDAEMDRVTAGSGCGKLCPGVGAPTIIRDDGALQIKFEGIGLPTIETEKVQIGSDAIFIKIPATIDEGT